VEHHSTHTRTRTKPAAASVHRTGKPRAEPRLTALGTALGLTAVSLAAGWLDAMISGEPGVFFGVVFVLACVAAAVLVRPYDLSAAPISAPIAFAVAVALTADSGAGGVTGHAMGAVTALALLTGWLYAGTLCAAAIAAVRKVAAMRRARRAQAQAQA
jgi:hypothetical protein